MYHKTPWGIVSIQDELDALFDTPQDRATEYLKIIEQNKLAAKSYMEEPVKPSERVISVACIIAMFVVSAVILLGAS